jgi:outer membrane protein TolC
MSTISPRLRDLPILSGWLTGRSGKRAIALIASAGLVLSAGCTNLQDWIKNGFKVGPNYSRPPAPVASEWIDYKDPRVKSDQPDLSEWWRVFNDPALNNLMETAYRQNLTLRVAGSRILAAQAQRGIAVGNLFPQVQQASASYTRNKLPITTATRFPAQWFQNWAAGFNASWELDFWGRFRRSIEAANAELDASVEDYDDVLVILLADVATNYTQLRTFQERLRVAWLNVVSQYNAYVLAADKYILGATTERDVQQAKQILEQTRALIPQMEAGIRLANNQICILLGIPPRALTELEVETFEAELLPLKKLTDERIPQLEKTVREFTANKEKPAAPLPGLLDAMKDPKVASLVKPLEPRPRIPTTKPEVVVGIPADLVRRRPDVRRAERQVAAQSARIGVAEADFYPAFSLNGTIGLAAEHFNKLWDTPKSMTGTFGPSFQWNILNYGRILNSVRVQDARFQELAFTYQNTVLSAGREAEDSITSFLNAQEQTARLADSVTAAARTVEISFDQYRLGAIDFTPVVLFESTQAEQQDALAVSQGNIVLSLIGIYRALGGGWEMRLSRDGDGSCSGHAGHAFHARQKAVAAIQEGALPAFLTASQVDNAPENSSVVQVITLTPEGQPAGPAATVNVGSAVPIKGQEAATNSSAVPIKGQEAATNSSIVPLKGQEAATNSSAVPLKEQEAATNSSAGSLKGQEAATNSSAVPLKEEKAATNSPEEPAHPPLVEAERTK